jgi:hypothetical protein
MARTGRSIGAIDIFWEDVVPADNFEDGAGHTAAVLAAVRFVDGFVTHPECAANDLMLDVVRDLTRGGEFDITDEVCASAALYLAEAEMPKGRPLRRRTGATSVGVLKRG